MSNLTKAMSDISFLNGEVSDFLLYINLNKNVGLSFNIFFFGLKVCGESTTEQNKCSSRCGGTVCDGKCGTNSSSCSGLVDSYWKVINTRKSFDELYSKQELTFKGILTRV